MLEKAFAIESVPQGWAVTFLLMEERREGKKGRREGESEGGRTDR